MSAFIDITGQRFGRLVAEQFVETRNHRAFWQFRCDCGLEHTTMAQIVKAADYQGHGCPVCVRAERAAQKATHGESKTRLHGIWRGMRMRCRNPNDKRYADYGGRGIHVVPEWEDFETFRDWSLANGYNERLEIDRRDNDGPYSPANCRWSGRRAQCRNTRQTRFVVFHGRRISISEVAELTGVSRNTLAGRMDRGMSIEEAVAKPSDRCGVRYYS
jgi:hypothetical protein